MSNYYKKGILVVIIILFCSSVLFGYKILERENDNNNKFEIVNDDINNEQKNHDISKEEAKKIIIDISGAVENSGVYTLNENARVEDAIVKAGGLSECADTDLIEKLVNRAKKIHDGEKIYIPMLGDSTDVLDELSSEKGVININLAKKDDLMNLSGIGETYAERIIEYRKTNRFDDISEIKEVKGIGENLFEKIRNFITVD